MSVKPYSDWLKAVLLQAICHRNDEENSDQNTQKSTSCNVCSIILQKTPGDGFEPPSEEPESSVLPLDDPGIIHK